MTPTFAMPTIGLSRLVFRNASHFVGHPKHSHSNQTQWLFGTGSTLLEQADIFPGNTPTARFNNEAGLS
jgi:hypothetical protein